MMSENEKLSEEINNKASSLENNESSPSYLNKNFSPDDVDSPKTLHHQNNDADGLELAEKNSDRRILEKKPPQGIKQSSDVRGKVDKAKGSREKVHQVTNGRKTGEASRVFDDKSTNNSVSFSSTPNGERNGQSSTSHGQQRVANIPSSKMSDNAQGSQQENHRRPSAEPLVVPKKHSLETNTGSSNEPKTNSVASTSEPKKNGPQNSAGKNRPSITASHSLDLPEIHEFASAKEKSSSVKPKPSGQKSSARSSIPAEEEERSLHNHIRRKIFSTAANPFFNGLQPPENRIASRRFSELDHRRVFEMPSWQRKLSQLFIPPSQEELRSSVEDSQKLLNGRKLPTIAPVRPSRGTKKHSKRRKQSLKTNASEDNEESDRLDVLDDIQGSDCLSDGDSSPDSTDDEAHNSTVRRDELKPLMSGRRDWENASRDDTICSNRSSSFRLYYPQHAASFNLSPHRPMPADVSSFNSMASLIREKNLKKLDPPEEKKKPPIDYSQLIVSIVLLTVIVILVSLIYHYYHLHILSVFIFDRIKIVETDRVMEVMSVDDVTGYRAPLVKIRLGVEFPVPTKHTDCTDYLKYLITRSGEIRKSEKKRKRRGVPIQITSDVPASETVTSKPRGRAGKKGQRNFRRRKNMSGRPNAKKVEPNPPLPDAAALKSSVGVLRSSNTPDDIETRTESSGFWSLFNDIFTPIETLTDPLSDVSVSPQSTLGSEKPSRRVNQDSNSRIVSSSMKNPDLNPKGRRVVFSSEEKGEELRKRSDPVPFDERSYADGQSSRYNKYSDTEVDEHSLSEYFSENDLEESLAVEAFPFGVYDSDPFHFEDHFSNMQCVDFKGSARLQLTHRPPLDDVDCFSVHWESSSPDLAMKDCFVMDRNTTGVWWGMGDVTGGAMPLTKLDEITDTALYSGEILTNAVGGLLRRIWISSEGILVSVPFAARALLSVNALHSPRREFCLQSEKSVDYYHPSQHDTLDLDYTLCVAPSVPSLLRKLGDIERMDNIEYATSKWHRSLHPLPEDVEVFQVREPITNATLKEVANRFSCPIWRPWIPHNEGDIDQDDVMAYAESIVVNAQNSCGYVLLPTSWQKKLGSLEFDSKRFPNPSLLLESLRRKGLVLALTLSPLIDVEAPSFKNTSIMDLLVRQINSTLPILVATQKTKSAAVLDFTNPNTVNWYASELMKIKQKYGIEQFHLSPISTQSLPPFRRFYSLHPNPDYTIKQFIKAVSRVKAPLSTNTAVIPVNPPTFLTASYGDASWEMLEMLPNRILTISAVGGNLIDGGVVGGWSNQPGHIPDRELYVRWMGVSVFLPAMELSVLPSMYDSTVLSFTNELMKLREDLVIPRLRKNLNESLTNNYPLVSPLAMVFPKDLKSLPIGDQWFVGKDLMVAPVLKRGASARDIYLPPGIWKDGTYDKLLKGKRWLKNYRVMMGKVPHFILITPERGPRAQKNRKENQLRRPRSSLSP